MPTKQKTREHVGKCVLSFFYLQDVVEYPRGVSSLTAHFAEFLAFVSQKPPNRTKKCCFSHLFEVAEIDGVMNIVKEI